MVIDITQVYVLVMVSNRAPSMTRVPTATLRAVTLPSKGAVTLTSIFMAEIVHNVSPDETV